MRVTACQLERLVGFVAAHAEEIIKYIHFTVADVKDLGWEDKGAGEEGDEDNMRTDKQTKGRIGDKLK